MYITVLRSFHIRLLVFVDGTGMPTLMICPLFQYPSNNCPLNARS